MRGKAYKTQTLIARLQIEIEQLFLRPGFFSECCPSLLKELDRTTQVGNHDRAADDEGDIECLPKLGVGGAGLDARIDVVRDAVIASQHHAGGEAEQFFGLGIQGALFIDLGIDPEETLGLGGAPREYFLV